MQIPQYLWYSSKHPCTIVLHFTHFLNFSYKLGISPISHKDLESGCFIKPNFSWYLSLTSLLNARSIQAPFFHLCTNPVLGYFFIQSVVKSHILVIAMGLAWMLNLSVLSFLFVPPAVYTSYCDISLLHHLLVLYFSWIPS